jgi:hypothetical protein
MFFLGRHPSDERPALMVWRQTSLDVRSLEPLAYFEDEHSAQYFWSLLEQLVRDAAATGEVGIMLPPVPEPD